MVKYLVITDAGDGDISYQVANSGDAANTIIEDADDYGMSYSGIFEIDFEKEVITRTYFCQ